MNIIYQVESELRLKDFGVVSLLLLAIVLCVLFMPTAAYAVDNSITGINAGAAAENNGDYIIPIKLSGADNICGYVVAVENTVPGVSILVEEPTQASSGTYVINSNPTNDCQFVVWFSASGITAAEMPMFSLRLKVTDSSVTTIPIKLTVEELETEHDNTQSRVDYPVIEQDVSLPNGIVGRITSGLLEDIPAPVHSNSGNAASVLSDVSISKDQTQIVPDYNYNKSPLSETQNPEETLTTSKMQYPVSIAPSKSQAQSPVFGGTAFISACVAGILFGFRRKIR